MDRPVIVCLCGSTKFTDAYHQANLTETLAGKIVLTVGCDFKSDTDLLLAGQLTEQDKTVLRILLWGNSSIRVSRLGQCSCHMGQLASKAVPNFRDIKRANFRDILTPQQNPKSR